MQRTIQMRHFHFTLIISHYYAIYFGVQCSLFMFLTDYLDYRGSYRRKYESFLFDFTKCLSNGEFDYVHSYIQTNLVWPFQANVLHIFGGLHVYWKNLSRGQSIGKGINQINFVYDTTTNQMSKSFYIPCLHCAE